MASTQQLWTKYNGQGFAAEYAEYAKRATADESGNSLTLKVESGKVTEIGDKAIAAASATQDASGNVITTTYATKAELPDITGKADKVTDGTENHVISLDAAGNIKDSGIPATTAAEGTSSLVVTNTTSNNATTTTYEWKNWSYVTVSKKTTNSVLIGKTWYPYVQIGNLYWTTENLREPIGTKNTDYRIYDESTVVQRGYLYSKHAILKSNDMEATHTLLEESDAMQALLHDGWHVPTENELNSLCSLKGGYDGGCHFFATDAFDVGGVVYSREPLDTYGYKGYPSGYYIDNQYYSMQNYLFTMAKNAAYNGQLCVWYLNLMPGSWTNTMSDINMNAFVSVRLCKSAT